MNQQNKTERWEENFDKEFWYDIDSQEWRSTTYHPGNDFMDDIKDFISQLLSDARREERLRCLEALPKKIDEDDVFHFGIDEVSPEDSYNQALTTAEESIKKL